ncbi:MAG TPA: MurR/RpiR family transcriptional regulator [Mesorhizobium sp.]|jgi:DNA-binding MurR/RpiR family transcriptional regulator|nr:MurR/RpiR family transcriptional regulator [Mesorhizobium sp.]
MKDALRDPEATSPRLNRPVREVLTEPGLRLTPAEHKVVQVLLAEYPISGLGTATSLARRASVSDPTVVRLVSKLGFEGFAAFQACLLAEVEARLHSPLLMMETKRPGLLRDSGADLYLAAVAQGVERTRALVPLDLYDRLARMIIETKGQVLLLGGRFSRSLAAMLAGYLAQFRPGVADIGRLGADSFDRLVDLGRRDLLIVFDYRRYQSDVVSFASQAAAREARVVLFTDPWRSPIADIAEATLMAHIEAESPFDTLAPAVAQMEALVAQLVARLDPRERQRIEHLEGVREANGVTIGGGARENDARGRSE